MRTFTTIALYLTGVSVLACCSSESTSGGEGALSTTDAASSQAKDGSSDLGSVESEAGTSPDGGHASACAADTETSCREAAGCRTFTATQLDIEKACRRESAYAGCGAAGMDCDQSLTYARNASGQVWEFSSSCLPAGWSPIAPRDEATHWPTCADAGE